MIMTLHTIDPRREVRSRIAWVGWRWALRAWGRLLRLYLTSPAARRSVAQQFGAGTEALPHMGYGLFVGRK